MKSIFAILLLFVMLAFGGTTSWAFTVFQGGIFILFIVYILKHSIKLTPLLKYLSIFFIFLFLYTLLQTCFTSTILDTTPLYPYTLMRIFTLEHASLFFTWFTIIVLASQSAQDFKQTRIMLFLISVIGVIAVATAFIMPGEYIKFFLDVPGGIGPFLNRNHAGIFFILCAFAQLSITGTHITAYSKYVYDGKKTDFYIKQGIFSILFITLCTAAVFTLSRGAMVALASGILIYCIMLAFILPKTLKTRLLFAILTLCIFSSGVFIAYKNIDSINKFAQRNRAVSVNIRKTLYESGFNLFKDRPIFGIGVGAMPVVLPQYIKKPISSYVERLHSDPFELLLGVGLVGALPLAILFIWSFLIIFRRIRILSLDKQLLYCGLLSGIIAMFVSSCVDFPFYIPACGAVFFTMVGLAAGITFYREDTRSIHLPLFLKILIVFVCMLIFYFSVQKTLSARVVRFGRGLLFDGQVTYYKKAINYYPIPRNALYLGIAYQKESLRSDIPQQQKRILRALANQTAQSYLMKYPREKELSELYLRTIP